MSFNDSHRYLVPTEEDIEPNSDHCVLKNYLNIKTQEEMNIIEEQELERTELELLNIFDEHYRFTAQDICNIHELWLGDIYPSAGKYRTVNLAKADFTFANSSLIPNLMKEFEEKYLAQYTPCHHLHFNDLPYAIGVVHVELILIHPFREGNGRTARLLANLMAMQAKQPPLNFSYIDQTKNPEGFNEYIRAIHAGISRDYELIQRIFTIVLEQSIT